MAVAGEATTGEEAVVLATELQPDVVVMDLQMPGISGIEATRRILGQSPHIGVLVVTMFENDYSVLAAMRAGAKGYVLKDADEDDILRAIRAVGKGEAIFSPVVARRVIDFFTGARSGESARNVPPRADHAGARGPRPHRPGPEQPRDRGPSLPQPEDGSQPHFEHLCQAPGSQPLRGHRSR